MTPFSGLGGKIGLLAGVLAKKVPLNPGSNRGETRDAPDPRAWVFRCTHSPVSIDT